MHGARLFFVRAVGHFVYFLLCSRDDFRVSPISLHYKARSKPSLEKRDSKGTHGSFKNGYCKVLKAEKQGCGG